MREIKFRGKSMGGHWIYGLLTKKKIRNSKKLNYAIVNDDFSMGNTIPVIEASIGEFTGFKDIDGNEIFEGDILRINGYPKSVLFVIEYVGTAFITKCTNQNFRNYPLDHFISGYKIETIGNIHDNPELLEGGAINLSQFKEDF